MTFRISSNLPFQWRIPAFLHIFLLLFPLQLSGLNSDGILLLSFKYSVLADPLYSLSNWNYDDQTPCSWNGVTCEGNIPGDSNSNNASARVVGLVLPNAKLLGSIPPDLGNIQRLRHLDLSHNSLNGTLPSSLFNASDLSVLSLSDNLISGVLPELVGGLRSLQFLNLSDNALTGTIPENLTSLPNLTAVSLSGNYFSGGLPRGFGSVQILDLSSNLVNGSLPPDFQGGNLRSLNLSYNRLSGEISPEFASRIPANASLDLSFNDLTGEIPVSLLSQKRESFAGNPDLCGKPLDKPCGFPSPPPASPPSSSPPMSPPAFAAIPKKPNATGAGESLQPESPTNGNGGLKPAVIAGIVVGDLAGIGILSMIFLFIYGSRKKKRRGEEAAAMAVESKKVGRGEGGGGDEEWSSDTGGRGWSCLSKKGGNGNKEETSESETEDEGEEEKETSYSNLERKKKTSGSLVTVDGESEMELETLLKASAYILGATATSIVYKAVLEDGTSFAVRRIGESGVSRFRDFENQVRAVAKLRHPNLVRIRGFYWGEDEKLVIYDFVPNGSLANATYKKMGSSSPRNLPWDVRLRIARGVARGLTYLHDKKYVHGNLKPSNILLGTDMEPRIGDFGLERLVSGDTSSKTTGGDSARQFGSRRSTLSRDSFQDLQTATGATPSPSLSSASPYHAPESLRNLKPQPKWDVYSFGIVLLELLSGRVYSEDELSQWNSGFAGEDKIRMVLRMADVAIRADVEANVEAFLACFKLGFSCAYVVPQKRPCMKEALQILEKLPSCPPHNFLTA